MRNIASLCSDAITAVDTFRCDRNKRSESPSCDFGALQKKKRNKKKVVNRAESDE
jgi:hypothetical protein